MLGRYWLSAIALGLAVTSGALAQPQGKPPDKQIEQQAKPPESQQQQAVKPPPVVKVIPGAVSREPDASKPKPENQQQPPYDPMRDTVPQWIMAIAAGVGVILAGITLELLRRTLNATRDAATYAKRAAVATEATIEEAKASAAAAQHGAEAAMLSAKAAVGVEMPRMVLGRTAFSGGDPPGTILGGGKVNLLVQWGNLGRTDGIVVANCLRYEVGLAIKQTPEYPTKTVESVKSTMVVKPEGQFQFSRPFSLSADDSVRLLTGNARLWVYGYVEFVDFMDGVSRVGFCREGVAVPDPKDPKAVRNFNFTYGGPKAYSYNERLS